MKMFKLGITCFLAGGAISFASSPQAQAFSFGALGDVFGSFAPVLSDVFKADLGQYVSKIQSAASIADSLKSGDYLGAAAGVGDSLGEFGVVNLEKYRSNLLANSNYSASNDYGIGLYGNQDLAKSEGMESFAKLQNDANTSDAAQTASTQNIEGMSQTLTVMVNQAQTAAKSNNSLTVMKTIPAGLTALGGLVAKGNMATMDVARATKYNGILLTEIMAQQLQATRASVRAGQGRVSREAQRLGLYLGANSSGNNAGGTGYSTTQLPVNLNVGP